MNNNIDHNIQNIDHVIQNIDQNIQNIDQNIQNIDHYINDIDCYKIYNYIKENIDNILTNENIKNALDPITNKTTRNYMEIYDEKDAYIKSFYMTTLTWISLWLY